MSIAIGLELYNNMNGYGGYSAYSSVRSAKTAESAPAFSASDTSRSPKAGGVYTDDAARYRQSHDTLEIGGVPVFGTPADKPSAKPAEAPPYVTHSDGSSPSKKTDDGHCETCENRKYQDESGDSSVSFQNPTKISPEAASHLVRSHEAEHVSHNRTSAAKEGREIVSQSVAIHTAICPECGKIYVSGGTTRTVTKDAPSSDERFSAGKNDDSTSKLMDVVA